MIDTTGCQPAAALAKNTVPNRAYYAYYDLNIECVLTNTPLPPPAERQHFAAHW